MAGGAGVLMVCRAAVFRESERALTERGEKLHEPKKPVMFASRKPYGKFQIKADLAQPIVQLAAMGKLR